MGFTIGVTYWPRRKAMGWWDAFDRAETAEELAHIAAIGCHLVRVPLLWQAAQPSADRVDHRTLDRLGIVLDQAAEVGLQVVVDLQVGLAGGAFHIPDWALDFPPAPPPVRQIVGSREESRYQLRDPFSDPKMLAAQRRLFQEAIGYYADHPAAVGWSLGHELDRARAPESAETAAAWLKARVLEIREAGEAARLFWISDLAALSRVQGMRPSPVAETLGTLAFEVHPGLHPLAEHPLDSDLVLFTVALARALVAAATIDPVPIWIAGCGVPTVPVPGDPGTFLADVVDTEVRDLYFASEAEQAEFVTQTLEGLIAEGAAGCCLGYYADFDRALWQQPPLDRCRRARVLGLVRRDGSEKPAAEAVQRVRQRLDAGQLTPGQPRRRLEVDEREYWRDPERALRQLCDDYREGGHG